MEAQSHDMLTRLKAILAVATLSIGLFGCGGTTSSVLAGVKSMTLPVPSDPTTIATSLGTVHGMQSGSLIKFLGIPYAAPPTGALRFKAPQPRAAWTTTLQATAFGPECPQSAPGGGGQTTTEDCLYLNIYEPAPTGTALPVYMFIHGGGFSGGSGEEYDGTWLAEQGVIVVTINYRLGIFGYLALPALDDGTGDTGNYGLEDQTAALKWIKTNIAAFGGNVHNVTVGGESAGAMSTCQQLVSPAAQGLFVRAIVESGPCSFNWHTLANAEATDAGVPATVGCSGTNAAVAACLRSATLATLLSAQSSAPNEAFWPSVGGADIPVQPRTGFTKYPLLLGGNNAELGIAAARNPPTSEAAYESDLTAQYGSYEPDVLQVYPASNYPNTVPEGWNSYTQALVHAETDFDPLPGSPEIVFCNDVTTWNLAAQAGSPLYAYEFNDPNAPGSGATPEGPIHTSEMQYLFPGASGGAGSEATLTGASAALSQTMVSYWTNFMKTGNPNGGSLPAWPAYTTPASAMQLVPSAVAAGTDTNAEHNCAFWNGLDFALSRAR
jgi:para-nitrobenzyl esterase